MRYGTVTDLPGPDVIGRAVEVFGPAGHGLQLVERGLLNARLDSPAGHVALEVERTSDSRTDVTVETREFDREVQAFIECLPRYSRLGRAVRRRLG
jgi:hypothetical protein